MAIQINIALTKAGITIPAGSMIKPNTQFPDDIITRDSEGAITGKTRVLTMGLPHYASRTSFQNSDKQIGQVDQFTPGFAKALTDNDYNSLTGVNALLIVEGWLKDWLESQLGADTCTIIDPYA